MFKGVALITLLFIFSGCSLKHCRGPEEIPQVNAESPKKQPKTEVEKVWACKYDGSVQCEPGRARPIDSDLKELSDMTVFAKEKRSDSLLRVQVCGATTGRANCFQIQKVDLPSAEEKGFKQWTF
ncbi:MAG: hypothetical protein KDD25_09165 [Bdellovibrionales bacterium]|nr:hypothetical protein [Bdellovibrionales bacterium]